MCIQYHVPITRSGLPCLPLPPAPPRAVPSTSAHLADHIIPRLPVRQWVLSEPKRRRYHLERDATIENTALRIFLNAIERILRQCSPGASVAALPVSTQ